MLIINSPSNPTGKVFTQEEYLQISLILEKFPNVLVISDEVYDFLVFDKKFFTRFANIPNMFERTFTICSLGKKFSATGWRTGYVIASEEKIKYLL